MQASIGVVYESVARHAGGQARQPNGARTSGFKMLSWDVAAT